MVLILSAESASRQQKLALKKVVHHPINLEVTTSQNQAVVEFEILKQIHYKFQPLAGCAVPYPVAVFPQEEAFIMEYIEGNLLSKQLDDARYWGLPSRFKELERSYCLLGRWLKHFQTVTGIEQGGHEIFANLFSRCETRLRVIADCPALSCSQEFVDRTLRYLKEQASTVSDSSIPIAGRHGDFGDWNIMVNAGTVTVFDFLGYAKEPIAYDALKVLTRLQALKLNPLYSPSRIDRLQEQFLRGYGVVFRTPVPALIICEIYHKICTIAGCLSIVGQRLDYQIWNRRLLAQGAEFLRSLGPVVRGEESYVSTNMDLLGRDSPVMKHACA
ncbi:MAG TPA: phosphotransferase [Nitrospira sp.]|nr:phosphotransferase [Nitrospira sp.]